MKAGRDRCIEAISPEREGLSRDGEGQQLWVTAIKGDEETKSDEDANDKMESEPEEKVQEQDPESRIPKKVIAPKGPTKQEREDHELLHLPYRAWCKHCVRGRGRNKAHGRQEEQDEEEREQRVPRVSIDYFFMSVEEEKASANPMMVMIDEQNGNKYMRAVGRKGLGEGADMEWLIKDMHEEMKAWGYTGGPNSEIIMKSDGEPAIVAVREAVAKYHGGKVTPEQPPRGESQSNGKVEETGKTIREMVKVFKDQIEEKANMELKAEDSIMQWIVRWAAMAYSRFKVGEDGKTAWERQKGRKCRIEVVPIGESVWYKMLKESGEKKAMLESDWEDGVWLGHSRISSEVLVGTKQGVVRAWAIKRKADVRGGIGTTYKA